MKRSIYHKKCADSEEVAQFLTTPAPPGEFIHRVDGISNGFKICDWCNVDIDPGNQIACISSGRGIYRPGWEKEYLLAEKKPTAVFMPISPVIQ